MNFDPHEVFVRKLGAMFPDNAARERVLAILGQYGREPHEREAARVRLDILKVAGSSLEKVQEWVAVAKQDYRDVLAAAEYPSQLLGRTWRMPEEESTRIQAADREQYEKWIVQK